MGCASGPTASAENGVLTSAIGTNRDTDIAQRNRGNFKKKCIPQRLILNLVFKKILIKKTTIKLGHLKTFHATCVRAYPSVNGILLGLLDPRRRD
jgi:hypothetical protein